MKCPSNAQIVKRIMDGGPHGPMTEAFVIDALMKWANIIADAGPGKCDTPLVSGEAWHRTAVYVRDELNKAYGGTVA